MTAIPAQPDDAVIERWDTAIDCVLNSGLLAPYIEDFFRFVDGEITEDQFRSNFP